MEKVFEVIEHTADIGIAVYGANLKQIFSNAALGLLSLITEIDDIGDGLQRDLDLSAYDEDNLLVEWLNELIYIFDVEHIVFKRFEIDTLTANHLKVRCFGEKIDFSRHSLKHEVKAATYHMLNISRDSSGYKAQVIFDI